MSAHTALPSAGVLTKLDIMDKGTDARAVLDGQSVRLKHGWVAVVNLSMEVRCRRGALLLAVHMS